MWLQMSPTVKERWFVTVGFSAIEPDVPPLQAAYLALAWSLPVLQPHQSISQLQWTADARVQLRSFKPVAKERDRV